MRSDEPDLGFRFRGQPEDFVVEELPAFEPSGSGQHLWLWIEKRNLTTHAAIERLCRHAGLPVASAGHAGLKDKRAIARQALTLDGARTEQFAGFLDPDLQVLRCAPHAKKLRPGQSRGNRFVLRLRGFNASAVEALAQRFWALESRGLENRFGSQRLGLGGRHAEVGLAWWRGDFEAALDWLLARPDPREQGLLQEARCQAQAGAWQAAAAAFPRAYAAEAKACRVRAVEPHRPQAALACLPGPTKRLLLEAAQAELFNRWLERRGPDLSRLLRGDVCQRTGSRGPFVARDLDVEQQRSSAFEISAAGPLFGQELFPAEFDAAELETALLNAAGLSWERLSAGPAARLPGDRRVCRIRPTDLAFTPPQTDGLGAFLTIGFALPPGSFATALLAALSDGQAREDSSESHNASKATDTPPESHSGDQDATGEAAVDGD
jgi:tRNA pseudouridine13 synthase